MKSLLLGQIELLKKGDFEDWLIDAVINDLKKNALDQSQYNWSRSNDLVTAFSNDIPWGDYISRTDDLQQFTKEDIVRFANDHYKDNYIAVYKRNGKDPNQKKVSKPTITKVSLNKELKSPFHEKLLTNTVEKIQPVFVDYERDIHTLRMNKDVEVLYTRNEENDLFTLYYLADAGTNNNPKMKEAVEYLQYLGTGDMMADEVKKEFYKMGVSFGVFADVDQTYLYLNGLAENMDKGIQLFEKLLSDPKPDDAAMGKMVDGIFKQRDDIKKDKYAILWQGLMSYGIYGEKSSFTNVMTNKDLRDLKSAELIEIIKGFTKMEHRVLYFGPQSEDKLIASLNANHILPEQLLPVPEPIVFEALDINKPMVYWTNYDMVQAEILFLSKGEKFDVSRLPAARMFNEYFGGSMASPVFQELREAQGLAYSAFASYGVADKKTENDQFFGYIGTQADKQADAMKAMMDLLQNFPRSENGFDVARNSLMNKLESERITKTGILFSYEAARRRGLDHDVRKDVYEEIQSMTIEDVAKFQMQYVKGRKFNVVLVGDKGKLNFKDLQKYGGIRELTLDELFGYEEPVKVQLEGKR